MTTRVRASVRLATFREIVTDAPVSYSVYSAFSFYGARRGGELPGTWLVAALRALGHETAAVRQTLYRMEASRELDSRTAGRVKFYRLSPAARAEAEAGLAKIMDEEDTQPWDGEWTLVQFRPGTEGRVERERLRDVLRAEGFAAATTGLHLHPRDRSARLLSAAREQGMRDLFDVFRARRLENGEDDQSHVARHWNLQAIASRYDAFVARFDPLAKAKNTLSDETCFVLRFAVVFDYLEAAWQDPELTPELLPPKWSGTRARRLARDLYQRLLPGALSFGDSLR
jgi:phenylacetic acid degradation operon negative regulatory protein